MGYFANGTEGEIYEKRYCSKCVHHKPEDGMCPIQAAHELFNYELCDKPDDPGKQILDMLIPIKGIVNQQCTMFVSLALISESPAKEGK